MHDIIKSPQARAFTAALLAAVAGVKAAGEDPIQLKEALTGLYISADALSNALSVLEGGAGRPMGNPKGFALDAIGEVIGSYENAIDTHIWDDSDMDVEQRKERDAAYKLVQRAQTQFAALQAPEVVITIEGGNYQGAMASVPLSVEVYDVDNLKAEGKEYAARQAIFREMTAGMVVVG